MGNFLTFVLRAVSIIAFLVRQYRAIRSTSLLATPHQVAPPFHFDIPQTHPIEDLKTMLELQIEYEELFNKNQLVPRIRKEFTDCEEFNFQEHMEKNGINPEFGFDLLVQMVLHKQATISTIVGILRHHYEGDCQATAKELEKAVLADLVDWDETTRRLVVVYDISKDVQDELDRYQFPLPMIVPPRELTSNRDTGYYTSRNSVILKDNHHDYDVCLDHINRINKTRYRINTAVAHMVKNRWRALDKPKPDEELSEFQKRVKAFQKYNRTAYDVMDHLGIANGGEVWLTHKYDKRGRTYCQGYHINYQGNDWNKAVIEFAEKERI